VIRRPSDVVIDMTSLDSYVTLGRSGLRVSPLTLGTMTFGEDWGWGTDPDTSQRLMDLYLDAGGNSIDTANAYTNGHSEKIIGDYLTARPGRRPDRARHKVLLQPPSRRPQRRRRRTQGDDRPGRGLTAAAPD
jgi:predicted aldo/keto reductase-like oxidoreductase